jgi:hypothetical protein
VGDEEKERTGKGKENVVRLVFIITELCLVVKGLIMEETNYRKYW